jgi:hypothetical protein
MTYATRCAPHLPNRGLGGAPDGRPRYVASLPGSSAKGGGRARARRARHECARVCQRRQLQRASRGGYVIAGAGSKVMVKKVIDGDKLIPVDVAYPPSMIGTAEELWQPLPSTTPCRWAAASSSTQRSSPRITPRTSTSPIRRSRIRFWRNQNGARYVSRRGQRSNRSHAEQLVYGKIRKRQNRA